MNILFVSVAGVVGVLLRYGATLGAARMLGPGLPWGTLGVNVLGSFAIGAVTVLGLERAALSDDLRIALTVGLLGGFTTFSSFSLESVKMIEGGQWAYALLYISLSVILCLAATAAGMHVVR